MSEVEITRIDCIASSLSVPIFKVNMVRCICLTERNKMVVILNANSEGPAQTHTFGAVWSEPPFFRPHILLQSGQQMTNSDWANAQCAVLRWPLVESMRQCSHYPHLPKNIFLTLHTGIMYVFILIYLLFSIYVYLLSSLCRHLDKLIRNTDTDCTSIAFL